MIDKIRFLIVNDIHETWNALNSLKKLIQERKFESHPNVKNVICVLGDFSTIQLEQYKDQSILNSALKNTRKIVENLCEIEPFDTICVLPGNHDHPSFYDKPATQIFNEISNPHSKKLFNLEAEGLFTIDEAPDCKLSLFGIGGALPAFLIPKYSELNDPRKFQALDPKIKKTMRVWDGIPYNNDNCDEKEFTEVLDAKLKKGFTKKPEESSQKPLHQLIFCSHMGPWSSTSAMVKDKIEDVNPNPHLNRILTGSISMDNLFFESGFDVANYFANKKPTNESDKTEFEKVNVLASLHGHTHDGSPAIEKRLWEVYNFGPLQEGRFGIFQLEKREKKIGDKEIKQWEISSVEFGKMN